MERRRSIVIVAACLICALLSACSRKVDPSTKEQRTEVEPSSTPAGSPQPASQDNRPVIVCFGDSLTAGVAGRSYPEDLQDLLAQNGYLYRVDNQGVGGDTTTDGLARIENVVAEHPVLVVLEFGGNDGLRGVPVDSIRKNLEDMMVRLKEAGVPFALLGITLPPNYGADYVKSFTEMYPQLAKKYHAKFIPFLLLNVYRIPGMMQPDGIHPSGAGNKIVAKDVFTLIQPLLHHD